MTADAGTAPHLATPKLVPVDADGIDGFLAAIVRGFHGDFTPGEQWDSFRQIVEPERCFGFQVDGRWVATCGAYTRVMTTPGGRVPVAAVTVVTVHPSYRRRGLLRQMMMRQLTEIREAGVEPVALLWASEALIYGRFGYGPVAPRLVVSGQTRSTAFRPGVDLGGGSVGEISPDQARTVLPPIHADLLPERNGGLDRPRSWWSGVFHDPEAWRHGASGKRFALHYAADGTPDGWAVFRVREQEGPVGPNSEVIIDELEAASPQGYARLWRYVLDLDLVRTFRKRGCSMAEPLRLLVEDQRAITTELTDGTYARLVDVAAALRARTYAVDVDLAIEVTDPLLPPSGGTYRLIGGPGGANAERTQARPELTLDVRELAAAYLGGTSFHALLQAGLVTEHRPGAIGEASLAFGAARPPFCYDGF